MALFILFPPYIGFHNEINLCSELLHTTNKKSDVTMCFIRPSQSILKQDRETRVILCHRTRDSSTGDVTVMQQQCRVFNNLFARCQACLTAEGGH